MVIGREYVGLKKRFEAIFEDHAKAVEEGKCRMMDGKERVIDLVASLSEVSQGGGLSKSYLK
jgi:hypothetical protein